MDFSFIDDQRWTGLPDEDKSKMLSLAFNKDVGSDPRFNKLPDQDKQAMWGAYNQQAQQYTDTVYPPKERGIVGDIASNIGRGAADLVELTGYGLKTLDPDGGINVVDKAGQWLIDKSRQAQQSDALMPDASEQRGEGFISEGIKSGIRSMVPSLAPVVAGIGAGAAYGALGGPGGALVGGFLGGTAATAGLFGFGTYGQRKEEYSKTMDEKTAHEAALKQSMIEFGGEEVSNLAGALTFGVTKLVAQPLKQTAKELLKTPVKTFAAKLTQNALLNEVPTEMLQAALGAKVDQDLGLLPDGAWQEEAVRAVIPALTMSVFFALGMQGATSARRASALKRLNSQDTNQRVNAVNEVGASIEDQELRDAWFNMTIPLVENGQKIDVNMDLAGFKNPKPEDALSENKTIADTADKQNSQFIDDVANGKEVEDDINTVTEEDQWEADILEQRANQANKLFSEKLATAPNQEYADVLPFQEALNPEELQWKNEIERQRAEKGREPTQAELNQQIRDQQSFGITPEEEMQALADEGTARQEAEQANIAEQYLAEKEAVIQDIDNNKFVPPEILRRHPDLVSPDNILETKPNKNVTQNDTQINLQDTNKIDATEKTDRLIGMIQDQIKTYKSKGQKTPVHLIKKLAELKGHVKVNEESIPSEPVFGHPEVTSFPKYSNLIPIKVGDIESLDMRLDKTQKLIDKLQNRVMPRKGIKPLGIDEEVILEMLTTETLPEFSRLYKELEKKGIVSEPKPTTEQSLEAEANKYESVLEASEKILDDDVKKYIDKFKKDMKVDDWEPSQEQLQGIRAKLDYKGFNDYFSIMQKAKFQKIMDKQYKYDEYGLITRKEYIENLVENGGKIDGEQYVPREIDGRYRFVKKDKPELGKDITKSEFDYYNYLTDIWNKANPTTDKPSPVESQKTPKAEENDTGLEQVKDSIKPQTKDITEQSLEKEAKKYGSAEEFVKSQAIQQIGKIRQLKKEGTFFHGSGAGFKGNKLDPSKIGTNSRTLGNGFFFTDNINLAYEFAGKKGDVKYGKINSSNPKTINAEGRNIKSIMPEAGYQARKEGHDVLYINNVIDAPGFASASDDPSTVAFVMNGDIVELGDIYNKTKLTDIWNKANPTSKESLSVEKKQTKQALSEGKPVPESVLKDYPDLKDKQTPKNEWLDEYVEAGNSFDSNVKGLKSFIEDLKHDKKLFDGESSFDIKNRSELKEAIEYVENKIKKIESKDITEQPTSKKSLPVEETPESKIAEAKREIGILERYPSLSDNPKKDIAKWKKVIEENEVVVDTKFSTTEDKTPGAGISLKEIQSRFKNQAVTINKDKSISIRFKNDLGLILRTVSNIAGQDHRFALESGRMTRGGKILGKYLNGEIVLSESLADNFTMDHELFHFLSEQNVITNADKLILNGQLKRSNLTFNKSTLKDKKIAREEDQANMFAQLIKEREAGGKKPIDRMIQRIKDFIDGLIYIAKVSSMKLQGMNTAELKAEHDIMKAGIKLADEVISGKIFSRATTETETQKYLKDLKKSLALHKKYLVKYKKELEITASEKTKEAYSGKETPTGRPQRDIPVLVRRIQVLSEAIRQMEQPSYSETAEPWYSQLKESVEGLSQKVMPAQMWKQILKSNKFKQQGVKEEEVEWSGIKGWLDSKKGKVTKQEVLDYLSENNVMVEEVVKGAGTIDQESETAIKEAEQDVSLREEEDRKVRQEALSTLEKASISRIDRLNMVNNMGWFWNVDETATHNAFIRANEVDPSFDWNRLIDSADDLTEAKRNLEIAKESKRQIDTKFDNYQLPGAENYREVLLTLPDKFIPILQNNSPSEEIEIAELEKRQAEILKILSVPFRTKSLDDMPAGRADLLNEKNKNMDRLALLKAKGAVKQDYKSPHYDEPNLVVHVRIGDRTIDGKKAMHVSEVQSDMHQDGRKKGYINNITAKKASENYNSFTQKMYDKYGFDWEYKITVDEYNEENRLDTQLREAKGQKEKRGVPNAPFKKSWPLLAVKRLVRMAAEGNYDMIVFDTGQVQFDRWGSELFAWNKQQDQQGRSYWRFLGKEQEGGVAFEGMETELAKEAYESGNRVDTKEDIKQVVEKVMNRQRGAWSAENFKKHIAKVTDNIWERMQTEDKGSTLPRKEGMKGFYDRNLVNEINRFFNKKAWGNAKVELNGVEIEGKKLHSLKITPEMKSKALNKGMPLFQTSEDLKKVKERTNTSDQTAEKDGEKYKGSAEKGAESIENILSTLRKVATTKSDAAKVAIEKDQNILDGYRKLEALAKDPLSSVASKQKMLATFLKTLPMNVRAKVITPLTAISRYKKIDTHKKRIEEALSVVDKELASYLRRTIVDGIKKGVSRNKLAKNRIKKSTIGHEASRDLQFIRDALDEKDVASKIAQIESQISKKETELEESYGDKVKIVEEEISDLESRRDILNTFGDIRTQNLDDLLFAKEALDSIILNGRATWRLSREIYKESMEPIINKVQQDISGQQNPTIETAAETTKREAAKETKIGRLKGVADAVENSILSWEFLLNKLSKLSGSKILQSFTTTEMGSVVQAATKAENISNIKTDDEIHSNAKRIFNAKTDKELNKKFIEQEVKQAGNVFSYNALGQKVDDFVMSKMEAAYMYAIRKNEDSLPTFQKMGMTEKTFAEIEDFIGPELKAWVDYNVDEYLQDFHFSVNQVYRQVYGTNLTKTPGYISWYRDTPGKIQDKGIAASAYETGAKGMSKGAFKERVKNTNPYKFMSFNDVLTRHVSEMNNFKAWAMPTKVINSVFNNRKTQRLITQHHSDNMRSAIKSFQNDFTKSPLELRGEMAWLDKMRGNITTAMTALNPTIFLKQLTSIPAMAESIPTDQWIKHEVDFWANPVKAWNLLKDSKHWESRRTKGMERDIRTAQAVSGSQAVANVRNLKNRAMFLVKWGDSAAILVGGYPVYKHHFENNVADMGKEKAHEFALGKFEEAMDRTQQASGIKDQGKFQRSGSYAKLFSMFLTAPKQYTSQITAAIRKIHKNPSDKDAYKRLFIFGVMMPSLFQATASGMVGLIGGDEDDKDKFISDQVKAILQSPLNGIPIIRDLQKGVWESAMGEWYGQDVDYSPVTSAGQSLMGAIFNGAKLVSGGAKSEDEYLEKTINDIFETAGYAYGLPVETVRKMFMENWSDVLKGDTDYPIRRALGYSRYATGESGNKFAEKKRKLKEITDGLAESKNKLLYRKKHLADFREYEKIKKVQTVLNKYKRKINKLKSLPDTKFRRKTITVLETKREAIIKKYLKE